jgi:hypothetical protein
VSHFSGKVMVVHSTSVEYILSVPDIPDAPLASPSWWWQHPDASWMPVFGQMCRDNSLLGYDETLATYTAAPNLETLTALFVTSTL